MKDNGFMNECRFKAKPYQEIKFRAAILYPTITDWC